MSLKGSGHGVDLGTSTLSLMRSIFFSFLGLAFPYDPLNLFPFFVFLSPRPHTIGTTPPPPPPPMMMVLVLVLLLANSKQVDASSSHASLLCRTTASSPFFLLFPLHTSHTQNHCPHSDAENELVGVALWAGPGLSFPGTTFFLIDTIGLTQFYNNVFYLPKLQITPSKVARISIQSYKF
jgi:hypothetical protein